MLHLIRRAPKIVVDKQVPELSRPQIGVAPEPDAPLRYRRKSHKVSQGLLCADEELVLAQIKRAQAEGVALTPSQARDFDTFRRGALVVRYETTECMKKTGLKYRSGGAGADLDMPPVEWHLRQAEANFRVMLNNLRKRLLGPQAAASARAALAVTRAAPVQAALQLHKHMGHKKCAYVARLTGEPVAYVRRVLRESVYGNIADVSG